MEKFVDVGGGYGGCVARCDEGTRCGEDYSSIDGSEAASFGLTESNFLRARSVTVEIAQELIPLMKYIQF